MFLIDTHTHIYGEEFSLDLPAVIQRAGEVNVRKMFLPATDEASADKAVKLSEAFPGVIYPMLGLHPEDLPADHKEVLKRMESRLQNPHQYIGIGEVGLDFYWDASRSEEQKEAFCMQIEWALRYDLPLMIHSRAAQKALIECLEPYRNEKLCGVFHCFSGTAEDAAELLSFPNFYLGIGGIVTFKKSTLSTVLSSVPLNRLVLETDAPYMAPVPNRGKRNEPFFLPLVAAKLAEIYGVSKDEIGRITTCNALRIFSKAK